LIPPNSE